MKWHATISEVMKLTSLKGGRGGGGGEVFVCDLDN